MSDVTKEKITLGILGGGQLGRMSAMAAARLGIECVIFTPEENSPASQVVRKTIVGEYEDREALSEFLDHVDIITYEFENIPVETVQYLKNYKPVYPDEKLLEVSQDRIAEKTFLNNSEIRTTHWKKITGPDDIKQALADWKTKQLILKTTRFGYDGKGQMLFDAAQHNIRYAWDHFEKQTLIAEEIVPFDHELSVIIARDEQGHTQSYGPMINEHENHILYKTTYPTKLTTETKRKALEMAETLARRIDLRGVLTLELFLNKNGYLIANEIAPRTHNSGHWTIDACSCSQFENHIRAVCGLPLGDATVHSKAEMYNLIGDNVHMAAKYYGKKNTNIHLYGKSEIREGRKMGHITLLK